MAEEIERGGSGTLMISHDYWQGHFGGDPRLIERSIRIDGRAVEIGAVLPPGFRFPAKTDPWVMLPRTTTNEYRAAHNYLAVGRLKAGVSLDQAQAEMASITRRLEQLYPGSNIGTGTFGIDMWQFELS